ncbi:MAG: alanine--tRNA ligase-related protein [Candidatus Woesearchaeota archaeon]
MNDKEIKEIMRHEASKNPEKFYPIDFLKNEIKFVRKQCKSCGRFFWTNDESRDVCGDSKCIGGFKFINNTPAKKEMSYTELWQEFGKFFEKRGYKAIKRYPVVARWNPTLEFTIASIADFQPYVVSGEIEPPANPLVVPQPCLRFNDIDNVGLTGSHFTNFVMIGQHAFLPPEKFNQRQYFQDIHEWLTEGMKIPEDEITYHEDAWAGGGNGGASLEFFSRGLELGNQVYTMYEIWNDTLKPLKLKVLDMGAGQERMAWFSQGKSTAYDTTFPKTINYIIKNVGKEIDSKFRAEFLRYAPLLNADEAENLEENWKFVAKKLEMNVHELKEKVLYSQKVYSIAEHTRSLLFSIVDGKLPSNVGGGYNLRLIFRRAYSFYETLPEFDFLKLFEIHAEELKPQYPELGENLDEVKDIVEEEIKKYKELKKKHSEIFAKLENEKIDVDKMITLYQSYGITPQHLKEKGYDVPEDFYKKLQEMNQQTTEFATKKDLPFEIPDLETKALYFDNYKLSKFESKFLWSYFYDGKTYAIPEESVFYPTSGGQLNDNGKIIVDNTEYKVVDVLKNNKAIVVVIDGKLELKDKRFIGIIDFEKRLQLAQHHTVTHLLNGVVTEIYGKHIWQHSAAKGVDKAKIDLTHHKMLTKEEIRKIEEKVREYIKRNLKVEKTFEKRNSAEEKYGFRIYQGGAVPGKELRIVKILKEDNSILDVEACGGTHLDYTSEIEEFKILDVKKPQDGIIRFEFVAGNAARKVLNESYDLATRIINLCKDYVNYNFKLEKSYSLYDELIEGANELSCGFEVLEKTISRFISEMNEIKEKYGSRKKIEASSLKETIINIFELWKEFRKEKERKEKEILEEIILLSKPGLNYFDFDVSILAKALEKVNHKNVLLYNMKGYFAFKGDEFKYNKLIHNKLVKGGGKLIKQGMLDLNNLEEIKKIIEE